VHKIVLWMQTVLVPMLGSPGMFLVAFCDSSFLSLPEINDILIVTSSAAHPGRAWLYILMTTLGSVAGCTVLWDLGRRGGEAFLVKRFGRVRVDQTRAAFKRYDVLALAIPALLPPPMPFKIFVLSAGVFGFPYKRFFVTLMVARGLRYAFWGVLGIVYGDEALAILQRLDGWFQARAAIILGAMAVGTLLLAYVLWRWRHDHPTPPDPDTAG
jgi:membrane protein YqaA with SNARE-associated domain